MTSNVQFRPVMNKKKVAFYLLTLITCSSLLHYVCFGRKGLPSVVARLVNAPKYLVPPDKIFRQDEKSNEQLQSPNCYESVFLVIVVFSAPSHFGRRTAIRGSWGKTIEVDADVVVDYKRQNNKEFHLWKTLFFLGETTDEELRQLVTTETKHYGDIVTGTFIDSYTNLTMKAKFAIEWAHRKCKFQYLLKTDDDVFVNMDGLLKWLWESPRTGFYSGRCDFDKRVVRKEGHKWAVSKKAFKDDKYPPYCLGLGYILSYDVLEGIMTVIHKQPLFMLEDVFVGLLISRLKTVKPVDNRGRFVMNSKYSKDICNHKHVLVAHKVKAVKMLELHLKFKNAKNCA